MRVSCAANADGRGTGEDARTAGQKLIMRQVLARPGQLPPRGRHRHGRYA